MTDLKTAVDRGLATGVLGVGNVARQDIDVLLFREPDAFNLFLLALRELQTERPGQNPPLWQDKMSFYQLAGIHGLPNRAWDNVRGKESISTMNQQGYCNHSTPTFPTWHRPYLAMFEQTLYLKMQDIAGRYTDPARRTAYQNAVRRWRLPFIDYHRPRNYNVTFPGVTNQNRGSTFYPYDFSIPQILTLENVRVKNFPADNTITIANPLAHYNFPRGTISEDEWSVSGISPNSDMKARTLRYPPNRFSRWDPLTTMNASVNEIREESTRLSLLFVENGAYDNYETYSTNGVRDAFGRTASGSLESIHGNYHVLIGGDGHMSSVPTAAFDPIFWLHHCTIDRWFAIWQKAHPNSWFRDRGLSSAPLVPFRNPFNQGSNPFWISDTARSTETFGYTYPELVDSPNSANLQARWRDQYAWARRLTSTPQQNVAPPAGFQPLDLSGSPFFQGIREFRPLNRPGDANSRSDLLPDVRNLVPQPTRRAMANSAPAQVPLGLEKAKAAFGMAAKPAPAAEKAPASVSPQPVPPVDAKAPSTAISPQPIPTAGSQAKQEAPAGASSLTAAVASLTVKAATTIGIEPPKAIVDAAEGAPTVATKHTHTPPISSNPTAKIDESRVSREYYVDDTVARMALNTSFTILYFLGPFLNSDSLAGLLMAPTFAGLNHVFAAPVEACDNCAQQEGVAHMVRSTSPITSMLLDYVGNGELESMRPEHVRPFLIRNLKWRVRTVDGRMVNPRELAEHHGFQNSVSCKVSPLPGETGEVVYETYDDITAEIIRNAS